MARWRDQHRLEILIPIPRGREAEAQRLFEALKLELTNSYGGVTAYAQAPAEGLWRDGGAVTHDRIVVLEVMLEELRAAPWAQLKRDLEQRLGQDEILIRATPVLRLKSDANESR